jgi:CubicO group peptidase (beta-lactamase class C family)
MKNRTLSSAADRTQTGRRFLVSRRAALAGFAMTTASGAAFGQLIADSRAAEASAGPSFSALGPDPEVYGAGNGYPIPSPSLARRQGNPFAPGYRVGGFSHFDELFPTRSIKRADTLWEWKRSTSDLRYSYQGGPSSLQDYLSRNPVTGLLVAKDDRILFEHYQYARADRDRLLSQSMVKSIMGLLIGIAVADGAIRSVNDTVQTYVPGFRGSQYGNTPIRDLLHMSSGVDFGEERDNGRDLNRLWIDMVLGSGPIKGTIASIVQFNRRIAPPGTRFYYASIEPDVLGVLLQTVVNQPASDYLREKIWGPIGAEADAAWLVDAQGFEVAHFGFNAILRDYARFGRLLAHDGAWGGRQIIPTQWMIDGTTVPSADSYLAPGKATPSRGYGYLLWLLPGPRRQFALIGQNGQRICIDPASKLVMVQTALEDTPEAWGLWSALVQQFGQA